MKQNNRKRKQHSSSGRANSTGTGNTVGPSPGSPQSTHTPGDGITTASSLQHVNSMSKSMMMYGADGTGGITSSTNQLVSPGLSCRLPFRIFNISSLAFWMTYEFCKSQNIDSPTLNNKLICYPVWQLVLSGIQLICSMHFCHIKMFQLSTIELVLWIILWNPMSLMRSIHFVAINSYFLFFLRMTWRILETLVPLKIMSSRFCQMMEEMEICIALWNKPWMCIKQKPQKVFTSNVPCLSLLFG